jgi:hypothetical protein
VRRYDLHLGHRLSYRLIAALALEGKGRRGQPIPDSPRPQRVGHPMKAESSVEESVKQIYRAIHRTPYRARSGQPLLDRPEAVEPYSCSLPGHRGGPGCDEQCPTWLTYSQSLSLPSDRKGSGTERLTRSGQDGDVPRAHDNSFSLRPRSAAEQASRPEPNPRSHPNPALVRGPPGCPLQAAAQRRGLVGFH